MEDGLGQPNSRWVLARRKGLNPCCNGIWSRTIEYLTLTVNLKGLNPCFSGRWSLTRPVKVNPFPDDRAS